MSSHSRYIPGLDGLRALAVLAVVIYHMNPLILPSGLLGVTLFFVLSGYLITGLLIREWRDTKTLNLPHFWLRRIRRLFPAIVFMLMVVIVLTAFLAPDLLTKLRKDLVAALFWFTNWWYIFQDLSYFDAMGAPSPVTHFWSLAIEEQFYLIWPPILLLLFKSKCKKRSIQAGILVAAVASVLLMILLYDPQADPSRVYYGTDTRAFSLLLGAWLAFVFPEHRMRGKGRTGLSIKQRKAVDIAGIVSLVGMIAIMVFTPTYSSFLYYGGIVLISLLTGVLILALVDPSSRVSHWFSVAPLVWIGKVSYGIYIWHYPLLLLMNDFNSTVATPWYMYLLQMIVIFAVAGFSYHFVEQPIRRGCLEHFWSEVQKRQTTWAQVVRTHIIQLICAAALLVGSVVACIVVPDTATQQHQSEETEIEAIVPEGALPSDGEEEPQGLNLDGQTPERIELLSSLGDNPALTELSDKTLQQLVATPGDDPAQKADNTQFIMVGDSVSVAFSEMVYGGFSELFPYAILDADYNRRLAAGIEVFESYLAQGWDGPVVVFELATNGATTVEELEEMVASVPEGKMIFIVNTRSGSPLVEANNEHIAAVAENHPNVEVIDWFTESAGHDEYFDGDGTHLTPTEGRDAYLGLIQGMLETLY